VTEPLISDGHLNSRERRKLVAVIAGACAFGYAAALALMLMQGNWVIDAQGRPLVVDFVSFWAAGHLALNHAAVFAYDPHLQHIAEAAAVGHRFEGALPWPYPPAFLFVAAVLALLPYGASFLAWCAATLAGYATLVAAIARCRTALVLACAAPWVLANAIPGQNGFLTAILIGLALMSLERRPALAGLLFGLLSYKPQFGILVPLALAAGGHWRAFFWAATGALATNLAAGAVFGFATFDGLVHALMHNAKNYLVNDAFGESGWRKIDSFYGLARATGFPASVAADLQGIVTVLTALAVTLCWRARLPFALKAAVLAAAVPLATPYVFVYDLPMLGIAAAFVFRHGAFDKTDSALLATTVPSIFAPVWFALPTPLFASLAVAALAARRCIAALADSPHMQSALGDNTRGRLAEGASRSA